jgi:hypothetical protein
MKRFLAPSALAFALLLAAGLPTQAGLTTVDSQAGRTSIAFVMLPSAAAGTCLKGAANVTLSTSGPVEEMTVFVQNMPANTLFTLFTTQVPNAPFGPSVYLGDIQTDADGKGIGQFVGRFSKKTFMVSPGVAPAPQEITKGQFPDANQGVKVGPVRLYHLGLWFNSPADAVKAHCANTVTPFNSGHNAGIQALNTGLFPAEKGPLQQLITGS